MNLDEMLIANDKRKKWERRAARIRPWWKRAMILYFIFYAAFVIFGPLTPIIAAMSLLGMGMVGFCFAQVWSDHLAYRFRRYMRCNFVPYSKELAANMMSKDDIDAFLWAYECHESHMPGDCPLCGAE